MKGSCCKCGTNFTPDYEGGDFGCEIPYYIPITKYIMNGTLEGQDLIEFVGGEESLLRECPICNYKWTESTVDNNGS